MSVTAVNPFENLEGGVDTEGVRSHVNEYHVYTNDKNDGSTTARGNGAIALGLPAYGDHWQWYNDEDFQSICKSRRATLVDVDSSRKKWSVVCGYTTKLQRRDPATEQGNPASEPWKISGSYAVGTRTTDRDMDGKAITNSVEEPVFTEVPSGHDTLILEGITANIDLGIRKEAKLHTNSQPMWGLSERQLLLMQWAYNIGYRAGTPYVSHRLEFHVANDDDFGNDKWDFLFIDKGTRILVDDTQVDPNLRYKPASARDVQLLGGVYLNGEGEVYDIVSFPLGVPLTKNVIPEYDFLANLTFLPNPLPGPFI